MNKSEEHITSESYFHEGKIQEFLSASRKPNDYNLEQHHNNIKDGIRSGNSYDSLETSRSMRFWTIYVNDVFCV